MNPPIVYEVTNPSAHRIKRITKIVQSMFQLLSIENLPCRIFLSAKVLSPVLLLRLPLGFRSGVNRAAAMPHKLLSFFDDSFAGLAQQVPRFFAREQRGHQPADGPRPRPINKKENLASPLVLMSLRSLMFRSR